jgi:hypothetical protein
MGSNVVLHRAVFIQPLEGMIVTCLTGARILFLHVQVVAGNKKRRISIEARVRYRPRLLAKVA